MPPSTKPTVLLTGFDAFGFEAVNPSWLTVSALAAQPQAQCHVVAAQLPTVFGEAGARLKALLEKHQPEVVICVGQAGGAAGIRLERAALNWCDANIPDNAGAQPRRCKIAPRGPAAYFATLPLDDMEAALRQEGLAVEMSLSAGSFVCNHVFYTLMQSLRKERGVKAGFIHLPYLPEQAAAFQAPSMALQDMVQGLQICMQAAIKPPSAPTRSKR
jgi:pyroglutamyl-peptidase